MYKTIIIIGLIALSHTISAQSNLQKNASYDLSRSLEQGESDIKIAEGYEKTAKEMLAKKDYTRAEDYFNRAKKLYEKLKNKDKIAEIDREIAKMYEAQNEVEKAISSYNDAGKVSRNQLQKSLNENDAQRLANSSNPRIQSDYIQQNLNLLENTANTKDRAAAYQQMADVNIQMNNKVEAIENLNYALKEVKEPVDVIKINQNIAKIYVDNKDYDKAIEINKKMVKEAQKSNDASLEIEQLQNLSSVYLDAEDKSKAISSLQQAYQIAIEQGHTIDAKHTTELMADYYTTNKESRKALSVYADFMNKLETLIKADSSLIDAQRFQATEDKISQLEKERALSEQLIRKKNITNYILIGSVILILVFLIVISRALYSIKKKNKRIALQSLRREMNPHFIFNSLNSVNQFIAQNNELEANKYLSSYSKLMRNIMENSNKDFIPLSLEIEQMKEYLDLEHLRFKDKFSYTIEIDSTLDTDAVTVPNMLIQPHLENAIWHGLRYRESDGLLKLKFENKNRYLEVTIEDNGIGLKKSREIKTEHQKKHQSRGQNNTLERIGLLNNLYNIHITIEVIDKAAPETGVIVVLRFPLTKK
ncbi:tetratricopeptide repeat-containing sensor histidine kinase [Dysgonomonas macrotermitis]|uniref:Tetratricopeptide repeat-containing protein n=1 Tax=Dysgonomonas macrotermitis TaxID=1346286 RepID=A0A1M5CJW1_9BACT|nr:histidine kinase [Dysgonomonas macrotermitis]SHF55055.1 Tetratricopeptide repeat-containing protein [Dysgonomonas macrotermitis]